MELKPVLSASEAAGFSLQEIGGKAANLGVLLSLGLPVPEYFVLSRQAWELQVKHTGIGNWLNNQLLTVQNLPADEQDKVTGVARKIQQEIAKHVLCDEVSTALRTSLEKFGDEAETMFAVRSSVADEDSAQASFAGQMDSFLCVRGYEEIAAAIKKCWASAYSERAIRYRLHFGLPLQNIGMAVIVQKMIVGEVSGVLFTAHPVNGSRKQALLTAAFGLGEAVVSGDCAADEFTFCYCSKKVLHSQISLKESQLSPAAGSGTETVKIQQDKQQVAALTNAQIEEIAETGAKISDHFGQPQDIEWTLQNGRFYYLQTRPITVLPPPAKPAGQRIVWDNSNIQESYCGVTTPLTFSFASRAYATVYEQTMRLMGIPEQVISDHKDVLQNLLGLVKGRIYYNINNWYRGLLLLPSFTSNKADMERMMGLQDPVDFVEDKQFSFAQKLSKLPLLLTTYSKLLHKFSQLDSLTIKFREMFELEYTRVNRKQLYLLEISELLGLADELEESLLKRWQTPIINDFYVMMYNGRVRRWLEKAGVPDAAELQNRLLSGEEGMESTVPAKEVMRLAFAARKSEKIAGLFKTTNPAQLPAVLQIQAPEFYSECRQFIEQYGDRTMGELKLETITLRQDPSFLFGLLRSYLNSEKLNLEKLQKHEQTLRAEAEKESESAISSKLGAVALYRFRSDVSKFRKGVRNRENMRFARTRLFGLYRDIYLQIGLQLSFYGLLEHNQDIFYLTVDELRQYRDGRAASADLKLLVAARKTEFAKYELEDLPHHFETKGPVYHHNSYAYQPHQNKENISDAGSEALLKGTGCYPGIVEAEVRLVFTPAEALELEGHILCTLRTDPGWTPLFPVCKGIIVERGSTLSHSAVVARELGIPAIVNVPGVTKILQSGQLIIMNGATGEIEVVS